MASPKWLTSWDVGFLQVDKVAVTPEEKWVQVRALVKRAVDMGALPRSFRLISQTYVSEMGGYEVVYGS